MSHSIVAEDRLVVVAFNVWSVCLNDETEVIIACIGTAATYLDGHELGK